MTAILLVAMVVATSMTAPAPEDPTVTAFRDGDADFSSWKDQLSAIEGVVVGTAVSNPSMVLQIDEPESTVVIVPQPQAQVTNTLQGVWSSHLDRGGSLLIMDSTGVTNPFLIGHGIAVTGRPVVDSSAAEALTVNGQRPDAPNSQKPVVSQTPSTLLPEEKMGWKTLLQSGPDTFLDVDQNDRIDQNDLPGPHVLAASKQMQAGGNLAVFSSTTFFANRFFQDPLIGNSDQLSELILDGHPDLSMIIIDESHHGWGDPENQMAAMVNNVPSPDPFLPWSLLGLALLAALVSLLVGRIPSTKRLQPHELEKSPVDPMELKSTDGFFAEIAQQVAAWNPGQKTDVAVRATRGELRPDDKPRLIQLYDSEVNQHA